MTRKKFYGIVIGVIVIFATIELYLLSQKKHHQKQQLERPAPKTRQVAHPIAKTTSIPKRAIRAFHHTQPSLEIEYSADEPIISTAPPPPMPKELTMDPALWSIINTVFPRILVQKEQEDDPTFARRAGEGSFVLVQEENGDISVQRVIGQNTDSEGEPIRSNTRSEIILSPEDHHSFTIKSRETATLSGGYDVPIYNVTVSLDSMEATLREAAQFNELFFHREKDESEKEKLRTHMDQAEHLMGETWDTLGIRQEVLDAILYGAEREFGEYLQTHPDELEENP